MNLKCFPYKESVEQLKSLNGEIKGNAKFGISKALTHRNFTVPKKEKKSNLFVDIKQTIFL
jgi:hypothetical protein